MKDFYAFGMGATSLLSDYRFSRPNNISKYYRYIAEYASGEQKNLAA